MKEAKSSKWLRNIPMMMTLSNALFGGIAIYLIYHGIIYPALYLVLFGAIMDFADGWTARRLHVASDRGASADSLGDAITFGLAPAVMVRAVFGSPWSWICGGAYLAAILFRLMRFRFTPGIERGFVGMPAPMSAMAVIAAGVLPIKHPSMLALGIPVVLIITALSVSHLPFPKWGHPAVTSIPRWAWGLVGGAHLVIFAFAPAEAILSLMFVYILVGPSLMVRYQLREKAS